MKNSFKFASKKIKKLLVELKTTRREKREAKAKDVSFRDKHLDECAAQYSRDHPGISIPNAVKQLKHIEKQKREARRIRRALKGKRSGALTYVLIPTAESYSDEIRNLPNFDHSNMEFIWPRVQVANGHDVESWEIVNDKEKVETLTLACMRKHFAQSQGTPFTSDDWIDKLSDKDIQNAIIAGQYDVSQHPEAIQLYLRALKRPKNHPPELKFEYSYSGFCQFIRKADEQTSASPSGRHYGHYKVLLKNCQHILFDVYRIMKLAFSNGIFLERYRRTVTTLIAKELNRPRIHRLRPIHIVEIELQAITKSQWAKNLINRAEKLNLITDSQYGGRCQRQAQSMVLNRTLIFDITRHVVKPLTCVDEDLKACYDRELAPLGALEDRYFGNSHEQGDYIIQATQKQNFFVKTNFGISKTAYCYTPENKIWGLGQGLGWSGARWTLTSSIIDKIMNERCSGLLFQGPKRDLSFTKLTDMFVDDLNQFCNHYPPNSSLVKQTTHNVQLHSDLVYTSGGILALDKCKYYHVDFYFDQDGKSHMFTKDQLPSEMQIKSALNEVPVVIEHIDSHNPHETLGYIITPSGNHKELYKIVENHVNDWVKHVTSSSLFPHEKILSYHTVLVPQVAYRLVGASFTYEECETLMKRIYPIMINAHGFHRSFSRAMAEAPYTYAGLNITHFYNLQGQYKLKFFMLHLKRNDSTGKLLRIALRYMQQSTGLTTPFYNHPFDSYGHLLPHSWLRQLFQYLDSRRISVELTDDITLPQARQNDRSIIELLSPHFTSNQMILINRIRIHLQVMYLSEISDLTGRYILPNILNCINYRTSKWEWPNQKCPEKQDVLWKKACRILQQHLKTHRLGYWKKQTQTWNWNVSTCGNYTSHAKLGTFSIVEGRFKPYFSKCESTPSACSVPADLYFKRERLYLLSHTLALEPVEASKIDPYNLFFENHDLPKQLEKKIVRLIRKNRIIYGSDATVREGVGAFAWGLMDKTNSTQMLIKSHAPVHGTPEQTHSTRGEMFGLLACLRHIKYLDVKFNLKVGRKIKLMVFTDSSSSITIAKKPFYLSSKNATDNDTDIKCEVRKIYKELRKLVDVIHVPAHQDRHNDFSDLNTEAKLNVLMDDFAKSAITKSKIRHRSKIPHLPIQQISLKTPFERITRNVDSEIVRLKVGIEAESYLQRRWKVNDAIMKKILWSDMQKVIAKVPNYRKAQYSKIIHKMWPTMKRNFEWKFSSDSKCPLCRSCIEDRTHVFQCRDPLAIGHRNKQLLALQKKLSKAQTNPILANHIIRIIRQYHGGFTVTPIKLDTVEKHKKQDAEAINAFVNVGADNIVSGVITTDIMEIQQRYAYEFNVGENFSILSWNRTVIQAILDYTNSLWQYRSEVLHKAKETSRESMIRSNALELLYELRRDPYKLPYEARDLAQRTKHSILEAPLSKLRSWITRINNAMDLQNSRIKHGTSDIREWLSHKHVPDESDDDGFYMPGENSDTYDSDATINFSENYPDENRALDTWDFLKCAQSSLESGTRMCVENCTCLSDENSDTYDSDATINFSENFPDENRALDTWDFLKCAQSSLESGTRMCVENCTCLSDRFCLYIDSSTLNNFSYLSPRPI